MNNLSRSLFLALFVTTTGAWAATPATNAPPAAPVPPAKAPAPTAPASKLDDYINELTTTLKLTDDEKKQITGYYTADGPVLKNILNNDALSPLQQAQQVSDLRDARNVKIEALLQDVDRQGFLKVEALYRVALTELAADGGLVSAPPPTPAPAPAPVPADKGAAK